MGSLTLVSATIRSATVAMDTINSGSAPDDWAVWTTGALPPDQRRSGGGSTVSNLSLVGGGGASTVTEPFGDSWTNGTPTASGSSVNDVFNSSFTSGFGLSFTLPADTNLRTAWFLVCPYNNANGVMDFSLSDSSATAIHDTTSLVAGTTFANQYLVKITYAANSASQTLTAQFTTGAGAQTVTLQAAAVAQTGAGVTFQPLFNFPPRTVLEAPIEDIVSPRVSLFSFRGYPAVTRQIGVMLAPVYRPLYF